VLVNEACIVHHHPLRLQRSKHPYTFWEKTGFRLGKFIRLVPHPVMFGFVNGLAIVIFLSQVDHSGFFAIVFRFWFIR
jgi:hypothetical protein